MNKSTLKYIGKRLIISAITLFVILVVLFLMVRFLPGSPINNEKLSAAQRAVIEAKYGLDKPLFTQFVASLVGNAAKISFLYGLAAVIIGTIIGMTLGVFAALHRNSIWDTLATALSVIGVSIPSFVFALLILIFFASYLRILPTAYSSSQPIYSSIMPVAALSTGVIANVSRFTRTEMIEVLDSDYMILAKAIGLDRKTLIFSHALRNALIPVITILGPILVNLMTGTMVVELLCSVPGLGKLLVNSILSSDYNIILACAFLYAAMYIIMMLVIDIAYGIIDPRIRLGKDEG